MLRRGQPGPSCRIDADSTVGGRGELPLGRLVGRGRVRGRLLLRGIPSATVGEVVRGRDFANVGRDAAQELAPGEIPLERDVQPEWQAVHGNSLDWPVDARERGDFLHRARIFPDSVREWRDRLVALARANPQVFPALPRGATIDYVRGRIDEVIAFLRELSRLMHLVHGSPNPEVFPIDVDIGLVLSRLGPFHDLGLDLERLDPQQVLADLVPPPLRANLHANLVAHGRAFCRSSQPNCSPCPIRKFCRHHRRERVAQVEASGAPTVIDLFAGAGGLSTGFHRAGFHIVAAADMDEVALKTYRLNHPDVPDDQVLAVDIRQLKAVTLRRFLRRRRLDVLVGAPPCQGFSMAGFRSKVALTGYRVDEDERNYLFEYLVGLALELKPRLFLMENVPGMEFARRENLSFLEAARALLEKKGKYRTTVWRLNAAAFGVPQERNRCFLVAALDHPLPPPPPEEYQNVRRPDYDVDALPPISLREAVFDLPPINAGTGYGVDRWSRTIPATDARNRRYLTKFRLLSDSPLIFNHASRYNNERDLELYALLRPGEDSVHAVERHGRADLMRYRKDVFDDKYARLRGERPSKTIVAHLAKDGNGYIHPEQVRSITPREAARLQSFDDSYAFCGSPSDQWVQIGNAVPPVLGEAIARSFMQVLERGSK